MQFSESTITVERVHKQLNQQAVRQTDQLLTLQTYPFGFCIVKLEDHGTDQATYGQQLHKPLSPELKKHFIKGVSNQCLHQYRQFYLTYPQIWQKASAKFKLADFETVRQVDIIENASVNHDLPNLDPSLLHNRLTYTHCGKLLQLINPTVWLKRIKFMIKKNRQ